MREVFWNVPSGIVCSLFLCQFYIFDFSQVSWEQIQRFFMQSGLMFL